MRLQVLLAAIVLFISIMCGIVAKMTLTKVDLPPKFLTDDAQKSYSAQVLPDHPGLEYDAIYTIPVEYLQVDVSSSRQPGIRILFDAKDTRNYSAFELIPDTGNMSVKAVNTPQPPHLTKTKLAPSDAKRKLITPQSDIVKLITVENGLLQRLPQAFPAAISTILAAKQLKAATTTSELIADTPENTTVLPQVQTTQENPDHNQTDKALDQSTAENTTSESVLTQEPQETAETKATANQFVTVRLKRRINSVELIADGFTIAKLSYHNTQGGYIGTAIATAKLLPDADQSEQQFDQLLPVVQSIQALYFIDDFMRGSEEVHDWLTTSGAEWTVCSLNNPGRSSNAFIYQGKSVSDQGGASLIGESFWDNYTFSVSAQGTKDGQIGLVLAGSLDKSGELENYALFRWQAREVKQLTKLPPTPKVNNNRKQRNRRGRAADTPAVDPAPVVQVAETPAAPATEQEAVAEQETATDETPAKIGYMELVEVINGVERILDTRQGGFLPGQWHRIGGKLQDGKVIITIDNNEVLAGISPVFNSGKVGLFVNCNVPAEFDDVRLMSNVTANAETDREITNLPWQTFGAWNHDSGFSPAPSSNNSFALIGQPDWRDINIQTVAELSSVYSEFALVCAFRDPENMLSLRSDGENLLLEEYSNGKVTILDHAALPIRVEAINQLATNVESGYTNSLTQLATLGKNILLPENFAVINNRQSVDNLYASLGGLADHVIDNDVEISLNFNRGVLSGKLVTSYGEVKVATFLDKPLTGRVGLASWGKTSQSTVRYVNFTAQPIVPDTPLSAVNQLFDDEELMATWSSNAGDWRSSRQTGDYDSVHWHRIPMFGNMEMGIPLPDSQLESWKVSLSIAKADALSGDAAKQTHNGYVLSLEKKDSELTMSLERNGQEKSKVQLPADVEMQNLGFRCSDDYLLGEIDGKVFLAWHDRERLEGTGVAFAVKGYNPDPNDILLYNANLFDYSFNEAPSDWRRQGGIWEVTNRWMCDPRWSFMGGMPGNVANTRATSFEKAVANNKDSKEQWRAISLREQIDALEDPAGKTVALWHKGIFPSDVVVDCFVGPMMMDQAGGSSDYPRFVRDWNVSISDGQHPLNGYAFIFGGWTNTKSAIVRNGKIVAEKVVPIPANQNIHHKWFHVQVQRRSNVLMFKVWTQDNRRTPEKTIVELNYIDPEPLPVDHLATWTYDTGMQLARLRISYAEMDGMENALELYPASAADAYAMMK